MYNYFLAQADTGKNSPFRYILSLLTISVGYIFLGLLPLSLLTIILVSINGMSLSDSQTTPVFRDLGVSPEWDLILHNSLFVLVTLCLYFSITTIHKRNFWSLFGKRAKRAALNSALCFIGYELIMEVIDLVFFRSNLVWVGQFPQYFGYALIGLVMIPLQSATEEIFFRGYLMQSLALFFRRPIIPLCVTSLLFAAIHMGNLELTDIGWGYLLTVFDIGLLFGVITLKTQSLWPAIVLHSLNNLYASLILVSADTLVQKRSLWRTSETDIVYFQYYSVIFLVILISYMAAHRPTRAMLFSRWTGMNNVEMLTKNNKSINYNSDD